MVEKTCQVCGKPSGLYPICRDCFKLREEGKVVKDEKSGKWIKVQENNGKTYGNYANKQDVKKNYSSSSKTASNYTQKTGFNKWNKTDNVKTEKTQEVVKNNYSGQKHKCLICSEQIDSNFLMCGNCYSQFQNKVLSLKLVSPSVIEFLGATYESSCACSDGHIVKSKSEALIDNYLFSHKILHAYEKSIFYQDKNGNKQEIKPDFYLNDYDLYIEHWGLDTEEYRKKCDYKNNIYSKQGITVIVTQEKDIQNIDANLDYILKNYKKGQINIL